MREKTALESFLGFMKLKNNENSVSARQGENAQDNELQGAKDDEIRTNEVEELTIANDDELKLCVQMFGEPMRLIDCKDFQ